MESQLIDRILNGDKDSFRIIVETYKKYVFTIIYNITHDNQETENIAQEVFLQIYSSLATYNNNNLKGWIGRIAANKAIDHNRHIARRAETLIDFEEIKRYSDNTHIEEEIIRKQEKETINQKIMELPDIYSSVINDYYICGKNYKEIAEQLGISVKTVESRLYRGKKLLADLLKEGG